MNLPDQANLNDVPDCLRSLADAIEADAAFADVSAIVIVRSPGERVPRVLAFGKGEPDAMAVFAECHIAAGQVMDVMRGGKP